MYTQILLQRIIHSIITKQQQLHLTQIYKKVFILLSAFILFGSTCSSEAMEFGSVKYNNNTLIDYSKINKDSTLRLGDIYFSSALNAKDSETRKEYLQKASGNYFVLTQIHLY